jgi:hypothetical protein
MTQEALNQRPENQPVGHPLFSEQELEQADQDPASVEQVSALLFKFESECDPSHPSVISINGGRKLQRLKVFDFNSIEKDLILNYYPYRKTEVSASEDLTKMSAVCEMHGFRPASPRELVEPRGVLRRPDKQEVWEDDSMIINPDGQAIIKRSRRYRTETGEEGKTEVDYKPATNKEVTLALELLIRSRDKAESEIDRARQATENDRRFWDVTRNIDMPKDDN